MICKTCGSKFTQNKAKSLHCCPCNYIRQRDRSKAYKMFSGRRQWARENDIQFTISIDDIETPTHCPVLGIELCYSNCRLQDNSPTLDKFIPELGYVPGNITTISQRANRIKSDANSEELRRVYEWVLSHTSS